MHSHIRPDFDDGAKNVKESLTLINELRKQGVKNICLTPHFYTNELSYDDYLEQRNRAFEKFLPYIPEDINIVLGCEVYVTDFLFNNEDLSGITYGKSRYILTEFPYNTHFSERTKQRLYMLIQNHGTRPVIPHVERYKFLMDHPDAIAHLEDHLLVRRFDIVDPDSAFLRNQKRIQMLGQCRLPGTVRSHDPDKLSCFNAKRDSV